MDTFTSAVLMVFSTALTLGAFHFGSSGCTFHGTSFSFFSKLLCLDLRFRFGVWV